MFDTLVCGTVEEQEAVEEMFTSSSKTLPDDIFRRAQAFNCATLKENGATKDPILQYLHRYYTTSRDQADLSDVGDLSWDEGDLPHHQIKVNSDFILIWTLPYVHCSNF